MWKVCLLLMVMVAYKGLTDADKICDEHDLRRCYPSHMNGISFPDNEEELNDLCPSVISYTNCLKAYAEECGIENSVIVVVVEERLEKYNQIIVEACDQSSKLHQDICANLGCLKGVFINHRNSCAWTDAVMDSARKYLHIEEKVDDHSIGSDEENNVDWGKFFCLHRALDLACLASDASEMCGAVTRKLLLDIFKRLGHLEILCTAENREGQAELLDLLELEIDSEIILREIFTDNYFS